MTSSTSVVYVAEDAKLGRRVALKVMSEELSENEAFRTRFIREAKMAANLEHPSIVPVYDAGEADGVLYLAMRIIRGTDLRRVITDGGPMQVERSLVIMRQVASALDSAHRAGLVHRDVKPANILLSTVGEDEHAYLSDFGLTKHVSSNSGLTKTGQFMGTIDYVAPEQIRGNEVDGRTDLYSLGCVLYECLTGQVAYPKDQDVAILFAHLEDEPPGVTSKRPDLPDAMNDVIARAMAKEKEDRYATCMAFVQAAREALLLAPTTAGPSPTVMAAPPTVIAFPPSGVVSVPESEERLEPHPSFPPADEPSIAPISAATVAEALDAPSTSPAPIPPIETTPPTIAPVETAGSLDVPAPPEIARPAPVVPSKAPRKSPESRRRTLVIVAIVAVLALIGGVAAFALTGGDEPAAETSPGVSQTPTEAPSPSATLSPSVEAAVPVRAPINVRATNVSSNSVTLEWSAAPNGPKAVRFLVFRDGEQIKKVTETSFVDDTVEPSTNYVYRIVAVGKDGSQGRGQALPLTTPAAPSTSTGGSSSSGGSGGGSNGCTTAEFLAGLC